MQGERSVLVQKETIFLSACKFSYQTDQQKLLGGGKEEVAGGGGVGSTLIFLGRSVQCDPRTLNS